MKWVLLPVVLFLHSAVLGQGTLKIYVTIDDSRHDMDIIDLNTAAIDNYGVSVDSTNMNFYTTTMSTQVVRLSHEQLYGPEERYELDPPQAGLELILEPQNTTQEYSEPTPPHTSERTPVRSYSNADVVERSASRSSSSKPRKTKKLKKSKRFKKYRGQCPSF